VFTSNASAGARFDFRERRPSIEAESDLNLRGCGCSEALAVSGATVRAHPNSQSTDPYMPCHGHASPIIVSITPNADGSFTATPLYFFMPGGWRMGLDVQTPDGRSDTVNFFMCIEG
jgi:hypothetical protein